MELQQFIEFFEKNRVEILKDLVKDYEYIGQVSLNAIENATVKNDDNPENPIKKYYQYWEQRMLRAITKMVIRGLASNKVLFNRNKEPYLLSIRADYLPPNVVY